MGLPNVILIDCDGVLAKKSFFVDIYGKKCYKEFHSYDNRALRCLISRGFEIHIVTSSSWPGLNLYMKHLGVFVHVIKDKSELDLIVGDNEFIAIGDDIIDYEMLTKAAYAFCPKDAHKNIKTIDGIEILETPGGEGVIDELLHRLMEMEYGIR